MNDYWAVLDERAMLGDPDEAIELEVFGAKFPTREELKGWRGMGAVLTKGSFDLLVDDVLDSYDRTLSLVKAAGL